MFEEASPHTYSETQQNKGKMISFFMNQRSVFDEKGFFCTRELKKVTINQILDDFIAVGLNRPPNISPKLGKLAVIS